VQIELLGPKKFSWANKIVILGNQAGNCSKNAKLYSCDLLSLFDNYMLTTVYMWGHRGRDHMVVGFTTTCVISAYHH